MLKGITYLMLIILIITICIYSCNSPSERYSNRKPQIILLEKNKKLVTNGYRSEINKIITIDMEPNDIPKLYTIYSYFGTTNDTVVYHKSFIIQEQR